MIYLDYNATTPIDERVLKAMLPFFDKIFANPASDHNKGIEAKNAVEKARKEIASLVRAKENEIIFTSGATESNNLALIGLARKNAGRKNHLITSQIEHPAILNPSKYLESIGVEVTYLSVNKDGIIDIERLEKSITNKTFLVSVMFANNETGTIEPIKQIGDITRKYSVPFHTDAAQAAGHVPIDVDDLNIDLMSISAHKFNGPKGIGALFIRNRVPRITLSPIIYGGGQERGIRSGTLNVPAIIGMGKACSIARKEMKLNDKKHRTAIDKIYNSIKKKRKDIRVNGSYSERLSHTLNIEIPDVDNKLLSFKMKDFCISTGSACSDLHDKPSHVLSAIGLNQGRINNCIRIGIGVGTKGTEINEFIKAIKNYI